ncbi:hypothetical protein [Burkholderia sp. Cy-637]|uniref:hypothetical protein n=1 Tax=Burkholderia sp. Cy-637 TaxID=2608327 RepID=UPI001422E5D3|nr:hypothetical protein [Burkholderia sp. Cy-637]
MKITSATRPVIPASDPGTRTPIDEYSSTEPPPDPILDTSGDGILDTNGNPIDAR